MSSAELALKSAPILLALGTCIAVGCLLVFGEGPFLALVLVFGPTVNAGQRLSSLGVSVIDFFIVVLTLGLLYHIARSPTIGSRLRQTTADFVVLLFAIMVSFSLVVRGIDAESLRLFIRLTGYPFLMYLAGRVVFSGPQSYQWLTFVTVGSLITVIELWVEHFAGHTLFVSSEAYLPDWQVGGFRAGSMLQGPNSASAYLALCLAASMVLAGMRPPWHYLGTVSVGLIVSTLLTTRSISGSLEMLLVIGVFVLIRGGQLARTVVIVMVCLLALPQTRAAIASQPWLTEHATSIQGRFDLLRSAELAFSSVAGDVSTLLAGLGYYRWSDVQGQFAVGPTSQLSLHNTYLTLFFESGLVAAASFALLLFLALWQSWAHRSDPVRLSGGLAILAFTIACGSGTLTVIPQIFGLGIAQR